MTRLWKYLAAAALAFVSLGIAPSILRAEGTGALAASVQSFVDHQQLAGAVLLVADKDKVLDLEAVGWADIAGKKPLATDALFWIASQSKPMTAAALMLLVDEGKVSVDAPVAKYLPEFKEIWFAAEQDGEHTLLKRPARAITVRDVLSHTSGLPFKSTLEQPTLDLLPLSLAVRSHAMMPLLFQPGSKYLYSNAGINTAGRIIEVVSGMPYERFLDERLFGPLGMKDTTFWPSENQARRLAKSYKANADKNGLEETTITQLKYPLHDRTRQPMPAGGLFSTAADVAKFCQMVLNEGKSSGRQILSPVSVKMMTSRQTPAEVTQSYGFGFTVGSDGTCGHGGAYATNMTIDRQHGLVTVWMVQNAGSPPEWKKSEGQFRKAAIEKFAK